MRYLTDSALKSLAAGVAVAVLLLDPAASPAQQSDAPPRQETAAPVEDDMVFVSAEDLVLSVASSDDVFAAGGTVTSQRAEADHLFLAGGEITVFQAQAKDLIAAGGEIVLQAGTIEDDVIAAGGDIAVNQGFGIGGSAVLAGGSVRLETPIGNDLRIGAGKIYVNSEVAGTARLSGESITLGPQTRIGGDLLYRSDSLSIDPGAIIEGRTAALPALDYSATEDIGKGIGRLFLTLGLSILVSYFILVVLLAFTAPRLMRAASAMILEKPLQSLGIGVLFALIVPVLIVLLVSTVFAAPLAVLLLAIAIALTPIGLAVTAYFTGARMRALATKQTEPPTRLWQRLGWPMLGALVIFALTLVPLLGPLVWLLAMLFGLGAFARQASVKLTT